MTDVKQVKVDNWGIYFLQRLKHFFNRTDYCDLTLQFQDNAQLKVHRLVLSACTEYFELLERTCEMYEDCLVMPDDLQADVVVPIVNFMYTGQLEFRMDLLESLYQTSQIMNMPVLTKLLDAHRYQSSQKPAINYNTPKRSYSKTAEPVKQKPTPVPSSSSTSNKRSASKAFGTVVPTAHKEKKIHHQVFSSNQLETANNSMTFGPPSYNSPVVATKKTQLKEPRPTRYELPEELDTDNIFDSSFTSISYGSQPLMVHPETSKRYIPKRGGLFSEASGSKKFGGTSTVDIVECKKVSNDDNIFEDNDLQDNVCEEPDMFQTSHLGVKEEPRKASNQLFDQILDHHGGPKVTIESKDNKQASNIDHAKIISEVLKKYPHLVKSNKNIKLKILNTPGGTPNINKQAKRQQSYEENLKSEMPDFTYETDVLDSKEAARLIALGAENTKGPWICLICGTPGRALHFTTYFKFRRHLVDIHNEKPVSKICEYCGLKSLKRNYLLHHLYTKHGVEPPPSYHFPRCNICSYVALTEAFLIKHKLSHSETRNFRCNVCAATYNTSNQLLAHIQSTGHKYSAEKRTNLQCIYCLKVFLRESNLYTHLKTHHKEVAKSDGIIEESDEERQEDERIMSRPEAKPAVIKYEPHTFEVEYEEPNTQYQIQQRPDGNIQLISNNKKQNIVTSTQRKQKILNSGLGVPITKPAHKPKLAGKTANPDYEYVRDISISPNKNRHEEIVLIDNNEYIMRDNQLIPRRKAISNDEYVISDMLSSEEEQKLTSTSMEFTEIHDTVPEESIQEHKVGIKKSSDTNQPIQIVVSNEEEYKALMNSNHSIIFDEGDANKTLTVLTTPHTTTLNAAAIDLDNTQSNDMMIIQDNYALNVSEALPADNSNIVVVYSHPVDDQNKGFQLITSHDLGAQFVPSSEVISQNYETMSTSTPVMNAHVIDPQVTESWQNTIQTTQASEDTNVQEMTAEDQQELTATETNDNSDELPEVTLTAVIPQNETIEENEIDNSLTETNEVVNEDTEHDVEDEMQNISTTQMDVDVPEEGLVGNVTDKSTEIPVTSASITQNVINNHQDLSLNVIDEQSEPCAVEQDIEEHPEETNEDQNEPCVVVQGIDEHVEEPNDEIQNANVAEDLEVSNNSENNDVSHIGEHDAEVTLTKITEPEIQNLASEWSEDEEETTHHEHEQNEPNDDTTKDEADDTVATEHTPAELEESIENIQQEMEKQMTEAPEGDDDTEESVHSSQEENTTDSQIQPETLVITEAPQEKISSLLNDWEDNDSQEENDSTNPNEKQAPSAAEVSEMETVKESSDTALENNELVKKDDKIKSLVSDWDEEDEENNS